MKTYSISEVADIVGVSATTVRNAVQAGKLEASKEPGLRGKYQVTQEALDAWVALRHGNSNNLEEHDDKRGQVGQYVSTGLIPLNYIEGVQDKLHGAIYRAGQAEARSCFLDDEVARLRGEKERERERYESRIRELEKQLYQQQKDVMERMEAREKAVLELIATWRETAATSKHKKRPWWKIWRR